MYGQIDIEITLDQAGILMLGQAPIAAGAGTLDTTLSSTNYQFLGDISTNNCASVASEAAQYVLSNIGFNIVRMDLPSFFMKRSLMYLLRELSINYIIQIINYLLDNPQQINPELLDFQ
jgi:hypothetical protein